MTQSPDRSAVGRVLRKVVPLACVLLLLGGGLWWWQHRDAALAQRLGLLPDDTLRASYTDWARVRATVGTTVTSGSSPEDMQLFVDEAFGADLSPASAIKSETALMQEHFGFSPVTLDWELYAQSREGAALVMKLGPDTDPESIADHLAAMGFTEPEQDRTDGGVWLGGFDLLTGVAAGLSPEVAFAAVLADEGLVATSDTPDHLARTVAAIRGEDSLANHELADLGTITENAAAEPIAAVYFAQSFGCEALALASASAEEQANAERLISAAGGLTPYDELLVTLSAADRAEVTMTFDDEDSARRNAESRSTLAAGTDPSGLAYDDRWQVLAAQVNGRAAKLELATTTSAYPLSALISGPMLVESC